MSSILSIKQNLVQRARARRKEVKLSQAELAARSGVSLWSVKRFEGSGEISLSALLRIAFILGYEDDFDMLFARKNYQSLDEIVGS